jgi:glutamate-1-semialdehyde 2,1-aminomutase
MNGGIPQSSRDETVRFRYNDLESLSSVLADDDVACVILEAATAAAEPEPGFLQGVRQLCDRHGSLLIVDEMITGFRWSEHGAQSVYGFRPDLSCWGKAMGNGFPISALAGKREIMELGGLQTDRERVFLLSTTHGAETGSLAAFRAVVKAYADGDPIGRMEHAGELLRRSAEAVIGDAGLADYVQLAGRASCLTFVTRDAERQPSQSYRTLLLQELLNRGVLGQSFVTSAAHTDFDIEQTVAALRDAMPTYRRAIESGSVDGLLDGRPVAPAIRRYAAPRQVETAGVHAWAGARSS